MSRHWIRSSDIVWEELDGEAVLVSPSAKRTWVLNPTASALWKSCDGCTPLESIARNLARAGRHELSKVKAELTAFCKMLEENGMLRPAPCPVAVSGGAVCFYGPYVPPFVKLQSAGVGFRGRPSSRGGSGPGP